MAIDGPNRHSTKLFCEPIDPRRGGHANSGGYRRFDRLPRIATRVDGGAIALKMRIWRSEENSPNLFQVPNVNTHRRRSKKLLDLRRRMSVMRVLVKDSCACEPTGPAVGLLPLLVLRDRISNLRAKGKQLDSWGIRADAKGNPSAMARQTTLTIVTKLTVFPASSTKCGDRWHF